ncbi:centromere protein F [Acipenser oxyrinchus oxyrinchus]|uniref:Centromere protein F n=1 Tax=Acipenser oxyrinchus oxyrinchus TaxID=40147 RepID=A0AAD8GAA1_ACIOX|nr:centromere protein F [Acipenser oxyrinchus oxyrinchus]
MSWVVDEWKDGLPTRALQKIQEMESQLDKLKKERQQRQFQLESMEAAFQKQKQKVENEKNEVTAIKRENQCLVESCNNLEKSRQKITHDLQVKEQQVNNLKGEISSSKKLVEKLEHELKRCKLDLERNPETSALVDLQQCGSPQKSFAAPVTPCQRLNDSKLEVLHEKYNKEVEERKRLEAELKILQVKLINQSSVNRKDIARHQAASSVFPWQQEQTPSRQSHSFLETPLKSGSGTSGFLWEQEETPYKCDLRSAKKVSGNITFNDSANFQQDDNLKGVINQDLKTKVSELELRLQAQEKDMKNHMNKLSEIQRLYEKAKLELEEKDKNLSKCRDELTRVTGQFDQTTTKCTLVEQKLKQVTEELSCQRHNAENSRLALEQKWKDQENGYQKELAHQQNSLQDLDKQLNQMKMKMSQELQQAKNEYNALQSEIDKVTAQRHRLEKDVDDMKQKLCRSEQTLQASQTKENDWRKRFEEMQKEKNCLTSQFDHSIMRQNHLEEDLKTAKQNLLQSHSLSEDLKNKNFAQAEEFNCLRIKLERQDQALALDLENMRKTVSELEKIRDLAQTQLKKQEHDLEQMKNSQTFMEKERQDVQNAILVKQKECEDLKRENDLLSRWKDENENLINNVENEKFNMLNTIGEMAKSIEALQNNSEKLKNLESEKENMSKLIDTFKDELHEKSTALEQKNKAYEELQRREEQVDQKHRKELENASLQISPLLAQVADLETKLELVNSKALNLEQSHNELLADYESVSNLAKSKDSLIELKDAEMLDLQNTLSQIVLLHEHKLTKLNEERCDLIKEHEKCLFEKTDETEKAKLDLEKNQLDASFLKDQVTSLESSLKMQKHLDHELQNRFDELQKVKGELELKLSEAENSREELLEEIQQQASQVKSAILVQQKYDVLLLTVEEKENVLQNLTIELESKVADLLLFKTDKEELKASVEEEKNQSSKLRNEKEELMAKLLTLEKAIENNKKLQDMCDILCQEKTELLREISSLSELVKVKEKAVDEMVKHNTDLEAAAQWCAQLKSSLADLQEKYAAVIENNVNLERQLNEKSRNILCKEQEMEALEGKCAGYISKIKDCEEKKSLLMQELGQLQACLENKDTEAADQKEKLNQTENDMVQLKKDLVFTSEQQSKLQDSYRIICLEKECLQKQVTDQQNEIQSLRGGICDAVEKCIEEANLKTQILENKLHAAEAEHLKNVNTLKEKENNLSKINMQLEMLQMDLEDKEDCLNYYSSQIKQLHDCMSILEKKLEESENQNASLQKELHSAKKEKDTEVSQTKELLQSLEDAHKHNQSMKEKYTAALEEIELCKSSLQGEFEKYIGLEKRYGELQADKSNLEAEVSKSKTQNLTVIGENNILMNNLQNLESERTQCQNERVAIHQKWLNLKEENQSLKSQLADQENGLLHTLQCTAEQHTPCCKEQKLLNKELENHHLEQNKKFALLQNEHGILQEQYSNVLSKVTEQQCLIEKLQVVEATLLMKLEREQNVSEQKCLEDSFVSIGLQNDEVQVIVKHANTENDKAIAENVGSDILSNSALVNELTTEVALAQHKLNEMESKLSTTNVEKEVLQDELSVLETSLQSVQFHLVDQMTQMQLKTVVPEPQLNEELNNRDFDSICKDQSELFTVKDELQRKTAEFKMLSQTYDDSIQNLKVQVENQRYAANRRIEELNESLSRARNELEQLQQQHLREIKEWEQKLTNKNLEMETKLAEEKLHTEFLSSELDTTRLQMQCLDLSSRSLLCDNDNEENVLQAFHGKECEPVHADSLIEDSKKNEALPTELQKQNLSAHYEDSEEQKCNAANETIEGLLCGVEILKLDADTSVVQEGLLETQAVSENLHIDMLQQSNEYRQLAKDSEENKKRASNLCNEIESLYLQIDVYKTEIASKTNVCIEMQSKVQEIEEEKLCLKEKLQIANLKNQKLDDRVRELEEEVNNLTSKLQTEKIKFSDVSDMLESLEMSKGGWDERFLELENELKRIRSEKANLEKHILSMEVDIEDIQDKKQKLEKELDLSQKASTNLEKQLNVATNESNQLNQELFMCTEEKEDIDQTLQRLKERFKELEKDHIYSKELIKVLEAEVKNLTSRIQIATSELEKVQKEKENHLRQLKDLEQNVVVVTEEKGELLRQLTEVLEEKMTLSKEFEALESKLRAIEGGNSRLSQSLESSLIEKGEIASRLNSTQEEVTQMRSGIEKLGIRIEADEKKRRHMAEQLKVSQRKVENLQDKISKLQQELEMSEGNFEDAVLRAEAAEAEREVLQTEKKDLSDRIEKLCLEANTFRSEKMELEEQLLHLKEQLLKIESSKATSDTELLRASQRKIDSLQDKIEKLERELEMSEGSIEDAILQAEVAKAEREVSETEKEELSNKMEIMASATEEFEKEFNKKKEELTQMEISYKTMSETLKRHVQENKELMLNHENSVKAQEMQVNEYIKELQFYKNEVQSLQSKEGDLVAQSSCIENKNKQASQQLAEAEKIHTELRATNVSLRAELEALQLKANEETRNLQQIVVEMHALKQIVEEKLPSLEAEKESLEKEKRDMEANASESEQRMQVMGAKTEVMQITIDALEHSVQQLENELMSSRLQSSGLSEQMNGLSENNRKLQTEMNTVIKKSEKMQEKFEMEIHMLTARLQTSQQNADSYKLSLETSTSEKEELQSNMVLQEQKMKDVEGEYKQRLQEMEAKVDIQESNIAWLKKEKDSALSKMQLWMKSCKQLEMDKETLQKEIEQKDDCLKGSDSNVEELQSKLEELKEALEEKTKEADDSMEKYCSMMINLHKLEETNEMLKNRVALLCSQVLPPKQEEPASAAQHKNDPKLVDNVKPLEKISSPRVQSRLSTKRQRASENGENENQFKSDGIKGDKKRIKGSVTPTVAHRSTTDDVEFQPDGLPDVVKKGFADIPTGEMSPFIIRRTVLRSSPRLAARRSPAIQSALKGCLESPAQNSKSSAGGSKQQIWVNETPDCSVESHPDPAASVPGTLLSSITNSPKEFGFESPVRNIETRKGKRSLSTKKSPEQREKHRQIMAASKQDENCQVQ